jgi:hypothetical protein
MYIEINTVFDNDMGEFKIGTNKDLSTNDIRIRVNGLIVNLDFIQSITDNTFNIKHGGSLHLSYPGVFNYSFILNNETDIYVFDSSFFDVEIKIPKSNILEVLESFKMVTQMNIID